MGVVSSLLFMAMHLGNAEVLRQSGFQVVLCALAYFVVAGLAYTLNVVFGNLMPGLVLHWSNNILIFTLTAAADGTNPTPALFLAESGEIGSEMITAELLVNLPLLIYLVFSIIKKVQKKGQCS